MSAGAYHCALVLSLVFSLLGLINAEIIGLFQVSRHGARTPIERYEWSVSEWPEGQGELTREGMSQSYILGNEFRERYLVAAKVTSQTFNLSEVYVRSTDYPRTIMSAQALLMGLFPKGPKLSKSVATRAVPPFPIENVLAQVEALGESALPHNFQPVPVEIVQIEEDYMLLGFSKACPKMKDIVMQVQHTAEYLDKVSNYSNELKHHLAEVLGKEMDMEEAAWVADILKTTLFHGLSIPEGIDVSTMEALGEVLSYCNSYIFESGGAHLATSEFYKQMITVFDGLNSGKSTRKWSIYLGHDTTIIGILKALDVWDGKNPDFASTVVFELHKSSGELYVKLWYNDRILHIGECGEECSFEVFKEMIQTWIVPDIHEACKVEHGRSYYTELVFNPFREIRT